MLNKLLNSIFDNKYPFGQKSVGWNQISLCELSIEIKSVQ